MTKKEIAELLRKDFFENFAHECANIIIARKGEDILFELLCDMIRRDREVLLELGIFKGYEVNKLEFRTAYVFEYVYFTNPSIIHKRVKAFTGLFPNVKGESAKRHLGKIMAHLLMQIELDKYCSELEIVASSLIDWILNKKVRVAVIVWAVESLIVLKSRYEWLPEILEEIIQNLSENPSAGMKVRLRKWKFAMC
jgi:hypothetical protein